MERLMRYFKNSPDAFISSWCPRNPLLSPVQTRTASISLRVSWSVCPTALNSGLRACEEAAAAGAGVCVCVGERVTRRVSANRVSLTSCSLDREEMKSLQAALQKQLDEANEKAEKQQATVRRRRHLTDRIRRPPPV